MMRKRKNSKRTKKPYMNHMVMLDYVCTDENGKEASIIDYFYMKKRKRLTSLVLDEIVKKLEEARGYQDIVIVNYKFVN